MIIIAFNSCSNNDYETTKTDELTINQVSVDNLNFTYNELSDADKIKVIVGEAISSFLINSPSFNDKLFSKLINQEHKTTELLYIKEKDNLFSDGKSLDNLLLEFYSNDKDKRSLISNINTILPNLVIKIPEWTEIVLGDDRFDLKFAVYPCLTTYKRRELYFKQSTANFTKSSKSNTSNIVAQYLAIQIEESEVLIPVEKNTDNTIWEDNLIDDHFPSLKECSEFQKQEYSIYENDTYYFIDKLALNKDLINVKLCGVPSPHNSNDQDGCIIEYERDCRTEKNVIEGIKLANNSVYTYLSNQPGGEDVLALNYKFVVASMCGDLNITQFCNPSTWTYIFIGSYNDFFETQIHTGSPSTAELKDVIYTASNYYIKAFPKYYDIPVNLSEELIYSQINYLRLTPNSTWDGNEYGSAISFSIYEHDSQTVAQTYLISKVVTNTTKVSSKLKTGKVFEAGADFSNTVKRTTSFTYEIEGEKDVPLGEVVINYYDKNYNLPDGAYGINHTSGSVNTHFAFYY